MFYGQELVAGAMYDKGKSFIAAAILLNRNNGHLAVALHLLCQGVEVVLKALLLKEDYDGNKPRLVKLGHDLLRTAAAARKATGWHLFQHRTLEELGELNRYYRDHLLRYGHPFDIFIDPASIPAAKVLRHCRALIKYIEQSGYFATPPAIVNAPARW